jgi:hypothetical protein
MDYARVGEQLLGLAVPRLVGLTAEKVGKLRRKCGDELAEFRLALVALSYEIETRPWDSDYDATIGKLIETKVRPALMTLNESLASLTSEFGLALVEKSLTAAPLPLLLAIVPGFPLAWTLPASVGAIWLREFVSFYLKRKAVKRNGLHFLLRLDDL